VRRLYADISPGLGWDGRDPEALEAATATQATARTVSSFVAAGVASILATPRPLAFLVGGATPAHAPATAAITGTDADDAALVEVVTLRTSSAGARVAGATCGRKVFKTVTSVVYSAGSGTAGTVAIGFGLTPGVRDVRGKIRFEYLLEALGDRSRPGMLDELLVDELGVSASGMVDGKLGAPNGNYDVPFDVSALGDIGRLTLDLWVSEAGKAHPGVIVVDHVTMRKDAERELSMIRKAEAGVGEAPPDPAANVGGDVGAIGAEAQYVPPKSFTSSLGDFA
jgi:hypothetical protein